MAGFASKHYVPILTWKLGEQQALTNVPPPARACMTPLLELQAPAADPDTGASKPVEQHVASVVEKMVASWGTTQTFFLDPAELALETTSTGADGASHIYTTAATHGLQFVPVIGLGRTTAEIAAAFVHRQRGLCLRVTPADLGHATFAQDLAALLRSGPVAPADVDLLVDYESIGAGAVSPHTLLSVIAFQLAGLPMLTAWRSLILAACSFPELGGVQGHQLFDRNEWLIWQQLYSRRATLPRMPSFGDYAIQSPEGFEGFDPRFMPISPSIRYTLADHWLIVRGVSSKRQRLALQYPGLAQQLVGSGAFLGGTHCGGCSDAQRCANGAAGFGSPTVWRRIGTLHHLVVATSHVAAMPVP